MSITKVEGVARQGIFVEGEYVAPYESFEVIGDNHVNMIVSSPPACNYVYMALYRGKSDVTYNVSNGFEWKIDVSKKDAEEAAAVFKKEKPKKAKADK